MKEKNNNGITSSAGSNNSNISNISRNKHSSNKQYRIICKCKASKEKTRASARIRKFNFNRLYRKN